MNVIPKILPLSVALFVLGLVVSCSNSEIDRQLSHVESIIETYPDSALTLLDAIDNSQLSGREQRAHYALLMSMALDKNYVDTATFDVLQPAIDYYLDKGNADQKLRTYYYQGRVYQNQGDKDMAIQSFIYAQDLAPAISDTLTFARVLVAKSTLQLSIYKANDYIAYNLEAAKLFGLKHCYEPQVRCLARASEGCILLDYKDRADSVFQACKDILQTHNDISIDLYKYLLSYALSYGSKEDIEKVIAQSANENKSFDILMDLANAYRKVGETDAALQILDSLKPGDNNWEKLKYWSIRAYTLQDKGKYDEALDNFKIYCRTLEHHLEQIFSHDLIFAQRKHDMQMNTLKEANQKEQILKSALCIVLALIVVIALGYNRYLSLKSKRELAEKEKIRAQFERDALYSENINLELTKQNLELERNKKALEAENLNMKIAQLEDESLRLKALLQQHDEFAAPVQEAIKERLEMLNAIVAKQITDNDKYSKTYARWLEQIVADKKKFMNSNRLAFKASHPRFVEYLESKDITEEEINYVCLYALGLSGKEIGSYIQLKGHYNISSDVRKKLGIGEHDTNLSIYIRRLMRDL